MNKLLVLSFLAVAGNLIAQEFKKFSFQYKLNGKSRSNTILVPHYGDDVNLPVRGVMQHVRGPLKTFAHNNQVAMITGLDQGRGFSKECLIAAAKAAKKPEIQYAGAIVQGISKGGRAAADWAHANRERAIAVILDHSAIWRMDFPKRVSGVPMFFNATYADLFQKIDRRKWHHTWNSAAIKANQPCTATIDRVKKNGHHGRGSTDLTAVWLSEVINLRVPLNVPVDKPYKLVDVNPAKTGAYVSSKISMDGNRSYHDNIKISSNSTGATSWVPGPKTAAMYLDWCREIGGKVILDESHKIKSFPILINLPANLKSTVAFIKSSKWANAYLALSKNEKNDGQVEKILMRMIQTNVNDHLAYIEKVKAKGDTFNLFNTIKSNVKNYKGIPKYDEKIAEYVSYFKEEEVSKNLKIGRYYYNMINQLNKVKAITHFNLNPLKNFALKYKGNIYGEAAKKAYLKLSKDPKAKGSPESFL